MCFCEAAFRKMTSSQKCGRKRVETIGVPWFEPGLQQHRITMTPPSSKILSLFLCFVPLRTKSCEVSKLEVRGGIVA